MGADRNSMRQGDCAFQIVEKDTKYMARCWAQKIRRAWNALPSWVTFVARETLEFKASRGVAKEPSTCTSLMLLPGSLSSPFSVQIPACRGHEALPTCAPLCYATRCTHGIILQRVFCFVSGHTCTCSCPLFVQQSE